MKTAEAFDLLKNGFECGRLAQAYIVVGPPRGAGRKLAEKVLQLLYCTSDDKPCGTCRECIQAAEHTHPDLLWVEPQKKSRRISIEQINVLAPA